MCGYIVIGSTTYDGSQCTNTPTASYNVVQLRLQPDDIAGAQFLYGAPAAATPAPSNTDAPLPSWAPIALGAVLIAVAGRRSAAKT
jgi:hypothetical protein